MSAHEARVRLVCTKCAHLMTVPDGGMPRPGDRCAKRECAGSYSFVDRVLVDEGEPNGRIP